MRIPADSTCRGEPWFAREHGGNARWSACPTGKPSLVAQPEVVGWTMLRIAGTIAPRERAQRQLAEAAAQQRTRRGGCDEGADPGAGCDAGRSEATTAEHAARAWALCAGKGHAPIPNTVNGERELVNGTPRLSHSLFTIHHSPITHSHSPH